MHDNMNFFKAASDATRIRLLHMLQRYELSVNEIVSILKMGQSRVSRHLKILSEAELLDFRRDGLWVFYSAPESGTGRDFLNAITPFMGPEDLLRSDAHNAARIIEERSVKTRQFFNNIAENWDAMSREVLGDFDLPSAVCKTMPTPCAVAVDLGCGTGSLLQRMLEHADKVIGVDGSARMLELARRRLDPVRTGEDQVSLRIGELDHLPLRDAEADFACINLVLHHLSNPGEAMREIKRIVKPGGLVMIADFDRHVLESMRKDYGDRWLGFDENTLAAIFNDAGFTPCGVTRHAVEKGLELLIAIARNE